MHHVISRRTYWRSGVVLDLDGNRALVRADTQSDRIYISIIGPEPTRRNALSAVRSTFRAIHGSISALEPKEQVPLPEDPDTLVDYEELLALERDRIDQLPKKLSDGTVRVFSVRQLLDGIAPPEAREREQRLIEEGVRQTSKGVPADRMVGGLGEASTSGGQTTTSAVKPGMPDWLKVAGVGALALGAVVLAATAPTWEARATMASVWCSLAHC